jgi:redox-sensitive bicupin YhaK (pirin superfamily)
MSVVSCHLLGVNPTTDLPLFYPCGQRTTHSEQFTRIRGKYMNTKVRKIQKIIQPQAVLEGAGVKLKRSIATRTLDNVDPFLLFDHFCSKNPADYIKGFPMHPHRGIETVTYMISGCVKHKDSIGNSGRITDGDVQWMTSGRGIMHEEMPQPIDGEMVGFQLWVNLPARLKMTRPRYQNITSAQIPEIQREDGVKIRVIAGKVDGVSGPVKEIVAEPTYLDISIPPGSTFSQSVERGHAAFAYIFEGAGFFEAGATDTEESIAHPGLIVFDDGGLVTANASDQGVRFLLISGKPLNETIARYGPFVMNTQAEIEQALNDLKNGTFIKQDYSD